MNLKPNTTYLTRDGREARTTGLSPCGKWMGGWIQPYSKTDKDWAPYSWLVNSGAARLAMAIVWAAVGAVILAWEGRK